MRAQQQRAYRQKVMGDIRGRQGEVWPPVQNGRGGSFPEVRIEGTEAPERSLNFKSKPKGVKQHD